MKLTFISGFIYLTEATKKKSEKQAKPTVIFCLTLIEGLQQNSIIILHFNFTIHTSKTDTHTRFSILVATCGSTKHVESVTMAEPMMSSSTDISGKYYFVWVQIHRPC